MRVSLAVGVVVFLSRLPFLAPGYGLDPDAWNVVHAARSIAEGTWASSRPPGHPLQELVYALLFQGGPLLVNGATAAMSALGAACLHRIAQHAGVRMPALVALAFAATPIVFVHSVDGMDYVWGTSLLLASLLCVLRRHSWLAGLALGAAIGCRATCGAMLLPLAWLAWTNTPRGERRSSVVLRLATSSAALSAALYAPVFWTYGLSYLSVHPRYPGGGAILRRLSKDTFGTIGVVGIALMLIVIAWQLTREGPRRELLERLRTRGALLKCLVLSGALVVTLFLLMPLDAGYLIPLVPFTLLALALTVPPRAFFVAATALALANVVDLGLDRSGESSQGIRIVPGALIREHRGRVREEAQLALLLEEARELERPTYLLSGPWWLSKMRVRVEEAAELARLIHVGRPPYDSLGNRRIVLCSHLRSGDDEWMRRQGFELRYIDQPWHGIRSSRSIREWYEGPGNANLDQLNARPYPNAD